MMRSPDVAIRRAWIRRVRADRPALRRLDVGLYRDGRRNVRPRHDGPRGDGRHGDGARGDGLRGDGPTGDSASLPTLEQAAAELHRLHRQRSLEAAYGSEKWLAAIANAYDAWLQVACQYLAVTHHLARLDGLDRDIERLRVEAELVAAGLELPSGPPRPR